MSRPSPRRVARRSVVTSSDDPEKFIKDALKKFRITPDDWRDEGFDTYVAVFLNDDGGSGSRRLERHLDSNGIMMRVDDYEDGAVEEWTFEVTEDFYE